MVMNLLLSSINLTVCRVDFAPPQRLGSARPFNLSNPYKLCILLKLRHLPVVCVITRALLCAGVWRSGMIWVDCLADSLLQSLVQLGRRSGNSEIPRVYEDKL